MQRAWMLCAIVALACGGDDDVITVDAGPLRDAGGAEVDAGAEDGEDAGAEDAGADAEDAGEELDAGPADEDAGVDGGVDAGSTVDAGPRCAMRTLGACDAPLECLGCPAGGPLMNFLCTTGCTGDDDCTDDARPRCNRPEAAGSAGICTPAEFVCAWGAICAAPDTPIATPEGERAIASLQPGELVYSMHEGALVAVPILRVGSTHVRDHRVMRVRLESGVELLVSPGHPTAEGGLFADLAAGDPLGDARVAEVEEVPYPHEATYDILPASDTGSYVAGGALIGSTLFE